MTKMENSEMFRGGGGGGGGGGGSSTWAGGNGGGRNNDMTQDHRRDLQRLKERDALIDIEIVNIGKGVDELRDLALAANEEVKLQNKMLDVLETKIDDVHEHVTNVNAKLKTTLEEARKSDKVCIKIICFCKSGGAFIINYSPSFLIRSLTILILIFRFAWIFFVYYL